MKDRPAIPESVKREVRQRCGFGCVICGSPIYHYDHMDQWALTKEHNAETLTLLCGSHHDEATRGILHREKIRSANNKPFNKIKGLSSKHPLHYDDAQEYDIVLGDNLFTFSKYTVRTGNSVYLAVIENEPLLQLTFDEGMVYLSCQFYDFNNKLVLKIDKNELVYSIDHWDITFVGTCLKINNAARDITLEIVFDTPAKMTITKAKLYFNGVYIRINENGIERNLTRDNRSTLKFNIKIPNRPDTTRAFRNANFRNFDCVLLFGPMPNFVINTCLHFTVPEGILGEYLQDGAA